MIGSYQLDLRPLLLQPGYQVLWNIDNGIPAKSIELDSTQLLLELVGFGYRFTFNLPEKGMKVFPLEKVQCRYGFSIFTVSHETSQIVEI